jgi:oligoendopeptidase F
MARNIDYEHDSEEVILLKKQIAEQGSSRTVVHAPRLIAVPDNRYSTLQSQLIKAKAALDDNKETLDETTDKVCRTLPCA